MLLYYTKLNEINFSFLTDEVCPDRVIIFSVCPVPDELISASSSRRDYTPQNAKLTSDSAWVPTQIDLNPYIEIDLQWNDWASSIETRGMAGTNRYVMEYTVEYRPDRGDWQWVTDEEGNKLV